jgi:hypothetical protein
MLCGIFSYVIVNFSEMAQISMRIALLAQMAAGRLGARRVHVLIVCHATVSDCMHAAVDVRVDRSS